MSGQYDNNFKGALFRNNDQRDGKKDPDYRGNCEIDGVQYWIDSWINESRDGKKFMSLRFKPKQASEHRGAARNPPARTSGQSRAHAATSDGFNEDIPF
jgi:hypothetical protein